MDFREPVGHRPTHVPPAHIASTPAPAPVVHHRGGGRGWLTFLLIIILVAAGAAAYWWRDKEAKNDAIQQSSQIGDLRSQVSELQSNLKAAQDEAKQTTAETGPSDDTLKKVQDTIKSGKYSDMQSLLASKVNVIIAASEGLGPRTSAQVITDLKYLDNGTDPWDFALSGSTVSSYQDGDYAQYFPVGALVGKSANNYVVSFVFNNGGKVTGIFMSNKADIL